MHILGLYIVSVTCPKHAQQDPKCVGVMHYEGVSKHHQRHMEDQRGKHGKKTCNTFAIPTITIMCVHI